ncbi:MAG TPA: hypothetical protein VGF13_04350, partial [Verrucomicrobiae bacterium]
MGVRLDPNQSAERAPGTIIERIFVKQITGRARRNVVLQRAGIEFLFVGCDCDREKIAARAFTD